VLINSCLSNLPVYAISMFWLSASVLDKMDSARKRFFLAGEKHEKEISLSKMDQDLLNLKTKGVWY